MKHKKTIPEFSLGLVIGYVFGLNEWHMFSWQLWMLLPTVSLILLHINDK